MSCSINSTVTSSGSASMVAKSSCRSASGTPAAGVPEGERHDILAAVAALPRDVTVLLIEHDMDLVFSFADRISVLVNGALLVEGPPEDVARDPQVKAVYLGEAVHG